MRRILQSAKVFSEVGGILWAFSSVAYSQEAKTLQTNAIQAVVSGEFRSEITYDDDGVRKEWNKDSKTAELGLQAAKLQLVGKFTPEVDFRFKLNLLGDTWQHGEPEGLVEYAHATWHPLRMLAITMGRDKVKQAGWLNIFDTYENIWGQTPYEAPFNQFAPVAAAMLKVAGELTIQMTNDVSMSSGPDDRSTPGQEGDGSTNAAGHWNQNRKQPAVILEYRGEFGPINPLFQMGQYDINHSRFFDVGAKTELADARFVIDYLRDARATTAGLMTYANLSVLAEYTVRGLVKPFFWFNQYERRSEKDALAIAEDVKVNTANVETGVFSWDDNAQMVSVGSYFLRVSEAFTPYLVVRTMSGKFLNQDGSPATLRQNMVGIGVSGAF